MQKTLTDTFIPKQLIKKSNISNSNTLIQKNTFQKIGGNIYLQIQPHEVKFIGYQLNKIHTINIKVLNKAPISQRVHILPPTQPNFSIKFNKKGAIPSGMAEIIQVSFKSSQFKYQYDIIKINTQTQNFIVPIYAYPSIPNLQKIFPKIIDFGSIQTGQSTSNYYPILNPIPLDFQFEFRYLKQCQQIMITPLQGIIPKQGEINIQIVFTPKTKQTYTAQVLFYMKQFDFEPFNIKIMGNGKDKTVSLLSSKRITSSKLKPINANDKEKDSQIPENTLNKTMNMPAQSKRIFTRSSFPKLLASKRQQQSLIDENSGNKVMNVRKIQEKQYLSRYNYVDGLDKQKDIKFTQFLGDKALTEDDIDFQRNIKQQIINNRLNQILVTNTQRYQTTFSKNVDFDRTRLVKSQLTFNDNKNDQLKTRRVKLNRLVQAGTKVILKYRMLKRLHLIQQFLKDCKTKAEVTKKVQQSYIKSLEAGFDNSSKALISFDFSLSNLQPQSFPIFFQQSGQSKIPVVFDTEGKAQFDDFAMLQQVQRDQVDTMKYGTINFPPDFVNLGKQIPLLRTSAQEQFAYRGASLPKFTPRQSTKIFQLPLKIPNHHFIYDNLSMRRFKQYNEVDEKDLDYLYENDKAIEDEYQGWLGGQYEILKAKFMRNPGVQYTGYDGYNGTGYDNDCGFLGKIDKQLPHYIEQKANQINQDILDEGDSDQQKQPSLAINSYEQLLTKIESNDKKVQQRRQINKFQNEQTKMKQKIQTNLNGIKQKARSKWVDKSININKSVNYVNYRLII